MGLGMVGEGAGGGADLAQETPMLQSQARMLKSNGWLSES
jgi:hypothetical protein